MGSRQCTRCGELKFNENFNWRYVGILRQSICRDCQKISGREHYESHTEAEKERTKKKIVWLEELPEFSKFT